ncbi:MAG: hypothetical protein RIR52_2726 [Acidobacteriota bacterium]|jgi:predicted DNA-binding antitoxin AbrB/MazE fold protein|nr:DUF104 domain-containing protein [Acidobacteriota bacterium]
MLNTVRAVVKEGRIELLENVNLPEGVEVLVTILSEDEKFWMEASEPSLSTIWNNAEDDIYEQLLER